MHLADAANLSTLTQDQMTIPTDKGANAGADSIIDIIPARIPWSLWNWKSAHHHLLIGESRLKQDAYHPEKTSPFRHCGVICGKTVLKPEEIR